MQYLWFRKRPEGKQKSPVQERASKAKDRYKVACKLWHRERERELWWGSRKKEHGPRLHLWKSSCSQVRWAQESRSGKGMRKGLKGPVGGLWNSDIGTCCLIWYKAGLPKFLEQILTDMVFINQISTHLTAKVLMCSFKTLCHLTGTVKPGLG